MLLTAIALINKHNLEFPQRIAGSGFEIENLAEVTNQPLRRQIQDGGQYEIYSLISSEN
jgi:hypothetical protein